ncbi:MAG: single-stranded DNA-binding protein [Clostridia bacterium]|nr:single-stranded DNA-binding protein [Clostridia bacterium]MBQ8926417.1 single-stranded DNA-binding protein [Clostridia bacterium]
MKTMRRITMTGRLTRDPELKELASKTDENVKLKRLTFGVANNDNGKEKDPEFFDVVCWDQLALWGQQYLKKGNRVLLTGAPHNEIYEKEGQKKFHFKIVADRIELIG